MYAKWHVVQLFQMWIFLLYYEDLSWLLAGPFINIWIDSSILNKCFARADILNFECPVGVNQMPHGSQHFEFSIPCHVFNFNDKHPNGDIPRGTFNFNVKHPNGDIPHGAFNLNLKHPDSNILRGAFNFNDKHPDGDIPHGTFNLNLKHPDSDIICSAFNFNDKHPDGDIPRGAFNFNVKHPNGNIPPRSGVMGQLRRQPASQEDAINITHTSLIHCRHLSASDTSRRRRRQLGFTMRTERAVKMQVPTALEGCNSVNLDNNLASMTTLVPSEQTLDYNSVITDKSSLPNHSSYAWYTSLPSSHSVARRCFLDGKISCENWTLHYDPPEKNPPCLCPEPQPPPLKPLNCQQDPIRPFPMSSLAPSAGEESSRNKTRHTNNLASQELVTPLTMRKKGKGMAMTEEMDPDAATPVNSNPLPTKGPVLSGPHPAHRINPTEASLLPAASSSVNLTDCWLPLL
ncbi:uncharacterized protein LACBIDRAFT_330017 [Laccaria bicolor S238N-H82]|uniref:Predicted protein n=1 Tax=Laccaria bicolor (strain S238N-H82 / ATCC MYA-4686) TaxID=486041 RepID=B0DJX5_LACBS|nr:uncharacterized protein LACBIDRAFT_330017 [Laccaria bicolor S238N-H82]EDR05199.1 predicted protein [Laccaria bicolor S238N-H82]|eukprot:XP_001884164.1 predicted protein [Laccaria bicolor S238N-H82]